MLSTILLHLTKQLLTVSISSSKTLCIAALVAVYFVMIEQEVGEYESGLLRSNINRVGHAERRGGKGKARQIGRRMAVVVRSKGSIGLGR
jgi:hypothetical protein